MCAFELCGRYRRLGSLPAVMQRRMDSRWSSTFVAWSCACVSAQHCGRSSARASEAWACTQHGACGAKR